MQVRRLGGAVLTDEMMAIVFAPLSDDELRKLAVSAIQHITFRKDGAAALAAETPDPEAEQVRTPGYL